MSGFRENNYYVIIKQSFKTKLTLFNFTTIVTFTKISHCDVFKNKTKQETYNLRHSKPNLYFHTSYFLVYYNHRRWACVMDIVVNSLLHR